MCVWEKERGSAHNGENIGIGINIKISIYQKPRIPMYLLDWNLNIYSCS